MYVGRRFLPADARAPDGDGDLSLPELLPILNALQRRRGLADPQVMLWVCEDANVGLGRPYCGTVCAVCGRHLEVREMVRDGNEEYGKRCRELDYMEQRDGRRRGSGEDHVL